MRNEFNCRRGQRKNKSGVENEDERDGTDLKAHFILTAQLAGMQAPGQAIRLISLRLLGRRCRVAHGFGRDVHRKRATRRIAQEHRGIVQARQRVVARVGSSLDGE